MKITLNFVARPWRWQVVAGTAAALAVVLLLASAWLALDYSDVREQSARAQLRLERLSAQLQRLPRAALPPASERDTLRARVGVLNAQGAARGWTTAQLLVWLEEKMPADVHLVSIHHKAREGEALLVSESRNAASLTAFLQKLEREPAFAEVLLAKQANRGTDADAMRFEIRLKLRG